MSRITAGLLPYILKSISVVSLNMITKALSSKLVLLVIGLAAGSGILIPAGYASFHPVTSSEIQNETILSVDIKNGEVKTDDIAPSAIGSLRIKDNDVKAQDIAPDAVGASEIATNAVGADEIAANAVGASEIVGVSNLIFAECALGIPTLSALLATLIVCNVDGAGPGDVAIATANGLSPCIAVIGADATASDQVKVTLRNSCGSPVSTANIKIGIIVFDTSDLIIIP